jgi:hypothetical protein
MKNFFGVKVDTSKMTLEELESTYKVICNIQDDIRHQIQLRKMANIKLHKPP